MPGRVDTKPARFELPALDLNFGSITDGTNIPPPPKSPVEKPAGTTAKEPARKLQDTTTAAALEGKPATAQGVTNEGQQSNGNGAVTAAPSINDSSSRPPSRLGSLSVLDDRKSKRSSGWFRRLRGGDSKRASLMFEPSTTTRAPSAPPPPMIPELKELEKDDGSLGRDLFKNIK